MTIRMDLNVRELNDLYYALGTLLQDGSRQTIGFAPRKQFEDIHNKVWDKLKLLNERIEQQFDQDLLDHNMGFKSKYIQHGDY